MSIELSVLIENMDSKKKEKEKEKEKDKDVIVYEKEMDMSSASRGVWLVKVPKYISSRWDKCPGNITAGQLNITRYNLIYI